MNRVNSENFGGGIYEPKRNLFKINQKILALLYLIKTQNQAKDNLSIAKQQVYRKPLSYHIFILSDSSNLVSIC